jgi:hypothetical protein
VGRKTLYEDELIWLAELVDQEGELTNTVFQRCRITGPAIIVVGDSVIKNCNLGAPLDHLLWRVPRERAPYVGGIVTKDCLFEACTFVNVGFAGPPKFLADLRASIVPRSQLTIP